MGNLFRMFFTALSLSPEDRVIVDTAAGLEHFGRRLESQCDHLLAVADPSYESLTMMGRMADLAKEAGLPLSVVLNKTDHDTLPEMTAALSEFHILGHLPLSQPLFMDTLKGRALNGQIEGIKPIVDSIDALANSADSQRKSQ